jgi:hypothetical protein
MERHFLVCIFKILNLFSFILYLKYREMRVVFTQTIVKEKGVERVRSGLV